MIIEMVEDRGGVVGKMDDRYCIDNGAMIAYAGLLEYIHTGPMNIEESTYT